MHPHKDCVDALNFEPMVLEPMRGLGSDHVTGVGLKINVMERGQHTTQDTAKDIVTL